MSSNILQNDLKKFIYSRGKTKMDDIGANIKQKKKKKEKTGKLIYLQVGFVDSYTNYNVGMIHG